VLYFPWGLSRRVPRRTCVGVGPIAAPLQLEGPFPGRVPAITPAIAGIPVRLDRKFRGFGAILFVSWGILARFVGRAS